MYKPFLLAHSFHKKNAELIMTMMNNRPTAPNKKTAISKANVIKKAKQIPINPVKQLIPTQSLIKNSLVTH